MLYGYARVSTRGQINGNSLEEQRQQLVDAGCRCVIEEQYTGKTMDRPELDRVLSKLQSGDTLMVTKLDRLARSATEGAKLIKDLIDKGINVNILNMGEVDQRPQGKLMLHILLAFAEFERDMIVERTKEGRAVARQKPGYREGRPKKYSRAQMDHAMELLNHNSYGQVVSMTGISKASLARERRRRKKEQNEEI